jgi:hypothetical protein
MRSSLALDAGDLLYRRDHSTDVIIVTSENAVIIRGGGLTRFCFEKVL